MLVVEQAFEFMSASERPDIAFSQALMLGPGVKAAGGDTQQTAHDRNRIDGLVLAHGLPSQLVSPANQAAASERIARFSFSCLFSRRRRNNSSHSALV
jgi:hypothetical protein